MRFFSGMIPQHVSFQISVSKDGKAACCAPVRYFTRVGSFVHIQSHLLNIHIGCNDVVSHQCVSKCAFEENQLQWLNSYTVCTCVVSPHYERGSVSSNDYFR